MNRRGSSLDIAFESARLSYSEHEVDLHNSGVNQILSVAAARRHCLYHFSMADLYEHDDISYARAAVLALPESWSGDPLSSYLSLTKVDERPLPLAEVPLCFTRGDDIRHRGTPNLDILQTIEKQGVIIESIAATLVMRDKYELVRRVPQIPQPITRAAASLDEALEAIRELPNNEGCFVLKDRFGYGCGDQVHLIAFGDPELEEVVNMYVATYSYIILQEFCPEVRNGDIVVTFFDGELIAPMHREAAWGEWRTNVSQGGTPRFCTLTPEQEKIARAVIAAFPECRYASVDMLQSGKVFEINSFPGGSGLLDIYGISVGNMVMDRLEAELLGVSVSQKPTTIRSVSSPVSEWDHIDAFYEEFPPAVEVLDVFGEERLTLPTKDIIEFRPRSTDFILSIPHCGVLVPMLYTEHLRLGPECLVEIDLFSDVLYGNLEGLQVMCRLAPFFVDMNREREGSKGKRIPGHLRNPATKYYTVSDETMLTTDYTPEQEEHILTYYDLYHSILSGLIEHMKRERGYALVIDGHSMTSVGLGRVPDEGQERANFVVGTLGDASAHSDVILAFTEALRASSKSHELGLSLAKDDPYSGGFITRKHHDPDSGVHAIQIEVTMDTYMYEPIEASRVKRYALKQPRVKIVQNILTHAIRAACEAAERIHRAR